jgi:hypothetical protein
MIAHQKLIRDSLRDDHPVPADFSSAVVREISFTEAKTVILKYEYLRNMGTTRRAFGLFFDGELAGVECFGATGGTNTAQSVCGSEYADRVMTLSRGACVAWADKTTIDSKGRVHTGAAASFLISRACKLMAKEGKNIFVAYADPDAGERGIVYRACNWFYCGMTNPKGSVFQTPSGQVLDEHNISNRARDRREAFDERNIEHFQRARSGGGAAFFPKPTRTEMRERMILGGYEFLPRTAKHRYVGIYGDRRLHKELTNALRWSVLPYPKRTLCTYKRSNL